MRRTARPRTASRWTPDLGTARRGIGVDDTVEQERDSDAALVAAVTDHARDRASDWFPDLEGGPRLHGSLRRVQKRPRSAIYLVSLSDRRRSRDVVVKVRRHDAPERRIDRYEGRRPILCPERVLPARETGRLEYEGLRLIEGLFGDADPARHGVLRALAWLPEHSALVMDHVQHPTLKTVLARQSRLRLSAGRGPFDERPWQNTGQWLRTYHRAAVTGLDERLADRSSALTLLDSYVGFLAAIGHDCPALREVAAAAGDCLDALPQWPELVVGHGDYVPQNLFVGRAGQVTGFDPMPLWRVPRYEDIARFTVGVRLLPDQSVSGGAALDPARLDAYERAFLEGYFGADPVPVAVVHGFQAVLLLDRWAALAGKRRGQRRAARRVMDGLRVRVTSRAYGREALRLAALLRDAS